MKQIVVGLMLMVGWLNGYSQTVTQRQIATVAEQVSAAVSDSGISLADDSVFTAAADSVFSLAADSALSAAADSILNILRDTAPISLPQPEVSKAVRQKRDWSQWRPDPKRALWLALVIPGGGQIYNRKYWKLPLVYGGFVGCAYAMTWNNMMYKDYSQAYLDLMDNDPGTASYNSFMHLGKKIDKTNEERYKTLFKKRKDRYRRYRDMSFFVLIGVYALSVIDAYVDAELSVFDISRDLSLKVEPGVINTGQSNNPLHASSLGLNCSLNF
jgi:hypothetical protein